MTIAVHKLDRGLAAGEPGDLGRCLFLVVRVHEVHELPRFQFVDRVAEKAWEVLVDLAEEPVQSRDAEEVEREVEEPHQFLLGPPLARLEIVGQPGHDRGGIVRPRGGVGRQAMLREAHERERSVAGIEPGERISNIPRGSLGPAGI